ncbi:hypothetical protein H5407_01025 [Mitsuaria sp. WAJ17]|uniref:hypothetical protein n=1 Tax=Mitsuaria sp. WAJ17 TaxID=2761452 RepID=UPI0015FFF2E0|nr:hypothetical protein [Mitsuaria sp. WAJ17]MBB2483801.1 hypothetical protein [Mitsuaria sp. WAJ17]
MQTRRFFTLLWRVNALIILVVGPLASALLAAAGYLLLKDATRTRHIDDVASTALGDVRDSRAELGAFGPIHGSPLLRAPLTVQQTYALGSGSKEAGSVRNYRYVDPSRRSAHWLLPSMDSVILSSEALPSNEYESKTRQAVAYVDVTVSADSSGDDRLSASDAQQIAMSAPDGKGYRLLADKADRLLDARLLDRGRLFILHAKGKKLTAIELNARDLSSQVVSYELPASIR